MKAVGSIAIMAATAVFATPCSTVDELCYADQVDIDVGCSAPESRGLCRAEVEGEWYCDTGFSTDGEVCGGDCVCYAGVCFESGSSHQCDIPFTTAVGTGGDPHMVGLKGQTIDWKGEDGGWYTLLSEGDTGVQINLRLTAPLAAEFPDRQLITGFALKIADGHSVVIQTKDPYTVESTGCSKDVYSPCLSENALDIIVDGEDYQSVAVANVAFLGGTVLSAVNLPVECQPYGSDVTWARKFVESGHGRYLSAVEDTGDWVFSWSENTAAPSWCEKFIGESGAEGLLDHRSKHAVFRIETSSFSVRLHHGTNHQGGEVLPNGRVLPELEFWQMDVHLEWFDLNADTVTGILGETMRPVLNSAGRPIMSGIDALRGEVEDYRVSGPLQSDFPGFHE